MRRKAKGPDGFSPKLFKICTDKLAEACTSIFSWSLEACEVSMLFKESTVISVIKI